MFCVFVALARLVSEYCESFSFGYSTFFSSLGSPVQNFIQMLTTWAGVLTMCWGITGCLPCVGWGHLSLAMPEPSKSTEISVHAEKDKNVNVHF